MPRPTVSGPPRRRWWSTPRPSVSCMSCGWTRPGTGAGAIRPPSPRPPAGPICCWPGWCKRRRRPRTGAGWCCPITAIVRRVGTAAPSPRCASSGLAWPVGRPRFRLRLRPRPRQRRRPPSTWWIWAGCCSSRWGSRCPRGRRGGPWTLPGRTRSPMPPCRACRGRDGGRRWWCWRCSGGGPRGCCGSGHRACRARRRCCWCWRCPSLTWQRC